jgi:cytoskeleton protein RodZ
VPERGVPAGAVVAVGLLLSLGAYVAWYDWTGNGERVVDAVPPVPARLEAQMAPQGGAASEGAGRTLPTGPREGGGASPAGMQAAVAPAPAAPVAAAPAPAAAGPAAEAPRLVIRAREEGAEGAWVQVREPNLRQPLLNRVLRPGESWAVPARAGLVLDTGKAENLEVLLDGQPVPALGNAVGVRRNIALDPGRLRSARQAGPVN